MSLSLPATAVTAFGGFPLSEGTAPTTCRIAIRPGSGALLLSIEDDGVGFDPAEVDQPGARRGLGLLGMRERVAQLGGTFSVHSVIGKGTHILVRLPAPALKESDLDLWKSRADPVTFPQIET